MKNIKIDTEKVIDSTPITRHETALEYLKQVHKNDSWHPFVFDIAELRQLDVIDDFSKWLIHNEWKLNYTTGKWMNLDNLYEHSMPKLYHKFLNQIKIKTK